MRLRRSTYNESSNFSSMLEKNLLAQLLARMIMADRSGTAYNNHAHVQDLLGALVTTPLAGEGRGP